MIGRAYFFPDEMRVKKPEKLSTLGLLEEVQKNA